MSEAPVLVVSSSASREIEAQSFCATFKLTYLHRQDLPVISNNLIHVLNFADHRTEVLSWVRNGSGPIYVDLELGKMAHRRKFGGGKSELVARAVGLKGCTKTLHIVDATAGLGRDALVLAGLGCQMTLFERNPVVYCLLKDGLERAHASDNTELKEILSRVELHFGNAEFTGVTDVAYLDPMFPERVKNSLVKKEMRAFKSIVGEDPDAAELLAAALQSSAKRTVVKRPRLAPDLAGIKPSHRITGKSSRFDVYVRKSLDG